MNVMLESVVRVLMEFLSEHTPLEQMPAGDIIFVVGPYDERVTQQAAYLWQNGKAPCIIIAGKGERRTSKGFVTEADRYASAMIGRGVHARSILLDRESTTLVESIQRGRAVWENAKIDVRTVIVCAISPLLQRACATVRKQCPGVIVHGNAFKMLVEECLNFNCLMQMVGEIDRLERYAEKGDTCSVEIPWHVREATGRVRLYCMA